MKKKEYRVISYYQENASSTREVLKKYFTFYIKNKLGVMEMFDE